MHGAGRLRTAGLTLLGPLVLQLKEARDAAPQLALGAHAPAHHGERVVIGQRMLQATSDVLLGWGTDSDDGIDYYVRQLWDAKGSVDVAGLKPAAFSVYASFCGWALARALCGRGVAHRRCPRCPRA